MRQVAAGVNGCAGESDFYGRSVGGGAATGRGRVVVGCAQVQAEGLRVFLASKFAKWQLPDAFVFASELPHTSVGKLLKAKLREQYANWQWE
jgi:acyl-CoA synthetase (AMP-forming)/AMP-acid ligase II